MGIRRATALLLIVGLIGIERGIGARCSQRATGAHGRGVSAAPRPGPRDGPRHRLRRLGRDPAPGMRGTERDAVSRQRRRVRVHRRHRRLRNRRVRESRDRGHRLRRPVRTSAGSGRFPKTAPEDNVAVGLEFDATHPPVSPQASVNPSTNLHHQQPVTVAGAHFFPNLDAQISQCATGPSDRTVPVPRRYPDRRCRRVHRDRRRESQGRAHRLRGRRVRREREYLSRRPGHRRDLVRPFRATASGPVGNRRTPRPGSSTGRPST